MKFVFLSIFLVVSWQPFHKSGRDKHLLSRSALYDKIKGGWTGQVIGVTYATEVQASASRESGIGENVQWSDGYQLSTFNSDPDAYDDVYIDLTFLEAIREFGVEVTPKKLAESYLLATYDVNHGCRSARYNLQKGMSPQRSGYWLNNPHADDSDFLAHADFIGLMFPGLPQSAAQLSQKVGHLMSYGDGYYGGLYVATLYSLAFVSNSPQNIIEEALHAIPSKSNFFQTVKYAVEQYHQYPYAWDRALAQFQRKWSKKFGCPERLIGEEDADAKINASYITLALLYGEGDFDKTLQIIKAMNRGDGNVATVAGILGVMNGYEKIPVQWKQGIDEIEALPFHHSTLSLADACDITFRQALSMVENAKGRITKDQIVIARQTPSPAKLERSFEGHYPKEIRNLADATLTDRLDFEFEGIGFVLRGAAPAPESDEIVLAELYLNNKYIEVVEIPLNRKHWRPELVWKFQLPHDIYTVSLRPLKKDSTTSVKLSELVVYDVTGD
ncbi:MAG TPA: ADP-ribosylglycohydrolase family protein [Chryseosolibacter sp.]